MKPIDFPQSTKVLQRPSTMTDSECGSLPVWNDGQQCVSCWHASLKERLKILFTGKVWLGVLSGKSQPPVFVSGESVFVKTPLKSHILTFLVIVKEFIIDKYESVKNGLKQLEKIQHLLCSFFLSVGVGAILNFFAPYWIVILGSLILGMIINFIIEWFDPFNIKGVDLMDVFSSFLGALLGSVISIIFILFSML